jgi:hypothetical protein
MAVDPRVTLRLIVETLFVHHYGDGTEIKATAWQSPDEATLPRDGADPDENPTWLSEQELIELVSREHGLATEEVKGGFAAMSESVTWDKDGNPIGPPLQ